MFIPDTILERPPARERHQWVAKPAHGGSCQGILVGKGVTVRQWEQERNKPYVYQRLSEASSATDLWRHRWIDFQEQEEEPTLWLLGLQEDGSHVKLPDNAKVKMNLFYVMGKFIGGFGTVAPNRLLINDSGYNFPITYEKRLYR
jgi:hypothetical protein